jgi:hypothetical protein
MMSIARSLSASEKGYRTLKAWTVDPGVVLEKLIVNTGGLKPGYFGPPESYRGSGRFRIRSLQ